MIELKRCPFCGGKASIYNGTIRANRYFVGCTRCTAAIGIFISNGWQPTFFSKQEAADAWNDRVEIKENEE